MAEKKPLFPMAKGEWRWPLAVAVILLVLTCLPYLFGLFISPPGYQYSGFLGNPDDQNVYLSYMRQARDGHPVFIDQFTTEPQKPWFFNVFFLMMGLCSRISGLSLILTYHLFRIIFGILLLITLYLFGSLFLEEVRARRFFLLLVSLASGLGWLYFLLLHPNGNQPHPPDFGPGVVMPELITFLTLLLNPLFCFSVFLLVSTLLLFVLAMERRALGLTLLAGLAGMLLANVHTYDFIPLALTVILYLITRAIAQRRFPWPEMGLSAIFGVMLLPPVIYQRYLYLNLPVFRLKAEVATLSPPLPYLLMALGLPLLFCLPGIGLALRQARARPMLLLPVAWFAATLFSAYLPFPFQRKMAEGLLIPTCLLASGFLASVFFKQENKRKRRGLVLTGLLLLACLPSNGFFLQRLLNNLQPPWEDNFRYLTPLPYLNREEVEALNWLEAQVSEQDAVLCNPMLGSYLPARTGAKTYVGHWAETINYPKKLGAVSAFLAGRMPPEQSKNLLRKEGIRYILIGPWERAVAGGAIALGNLPLREVFRAGDIIIYQVESG